MQYEHLVTVNDLSNPLVLALTRGQLWRGLMLRAEAPDLFLPGVEDVTILERSPALLVREMRLGNLLVRDRIHLQFEQQIRYDTEPSKQHAGGSLTVTITEPDADTLLVRFTYETPPSHDPEEIQLAAYLQKMWRQVDIDSICLIRDLAEQGQLG